MKQFLSNIFKSGGAGRVLNREENEQRDKWVKEKKERDESHKYEEHERDYDDLIYGHPGHEESHEESHKESHKNPWRK